MTDEQAAYLLEECRAAMPELYWAPAVVTRAVGWKHGVAAYLPYGHTLVVAAEEGGFSVVLEQDGVPVLLPSTGDALVTVLDTHKPLVVSYCQPKALVWDSLARMFGGADESPVAKELAEVREGVGALYQMLDDVQAKLSPNKEPVPSGDAARAEAAEQKLLEATKVIQAIYADASKLKSDAEKKIAEDAATIANLTTQLEEAKAKRPLPWAARKKP